MNPAAPVPGTYYVDNPNGATVYIPGNDIPIDIPTGTIITIAANAAHPQPDSVIGTYINDDGEDIEIILTYAIMVEQRIVPEDPIAPNDANQMPPMNINSNNNNNSNNSNSNNSNSSNSSNSNVNMEGGKLRKRKQRKTRKIQKQRKTRKQKSSRKSRRARRRN